jgi:transposase InsO family protein
MKFEMVLKIDLGLEKIGVQLSCKTLEVSRSGYYAWKDRPEAERSRENRKLTDEMRKIHEESRGTYGAPRLVEGLKEAGISCSRGRVARLMGIAGISGVAKKRYRVKTTDSNHELPVAERVFQVEEPATWPTRPNEVWVGDLTYVPTDEGWLYLTTQMDVFSRKIVGYAMTDHMRAEAMLEALDMAVLNQKPGAGHSLVSHSDRGCQYAAELYRKRLRELGITASMSRRGNCYDNAYAESFFHTLKVELVHRRRFATRAEASAAIFEYIEVWYNRKRMHSALGYKSPIAYERAALQAA